MAILKIEGLLLYKSDIIYTASTDIKTRTIIVKEPEIRHHLQENVIIKKAITYQIQVYKNRCDVLDRIPIGSEVEIEAYVESKAPLSTEEKLSLHKAKKAFRENKILYYKKLIKDGKKRFFPKLTASSTHLICFTKLNLRHIKIHEQVSQETLQQEILSSSLGFAYIPIFDTPKGTIFDRITEPVHRAIQQYT